MDKSYNKNETKSYPKEKRELIKKNIKTKVTNKIKPHKTKDKSTVKKEIHQLKDEYFHINLSILTDDGISKTTKRVKRPVIQSLSIRLENVQWVKNHERKSQIFADHLEDTLQPKEDQHNRSIKNQKTQEETKGRFSDKKWRICLHLK